MLKLNYDIEKMSKIELLDLKMSLIEEKCVKGKISFEEWEVLWNIYIREVSKILAEEEIKDILTNEFTLRELKKLKEDLEKASKTERLISCYKQLNGFNIGRKNLENVDYEELLEIVNNVLNLRKKRR